MKIADLYQSVTNSIVAELEAGNPTWLKPWKTGRLNGVGILPTNAATGRTYSGINVPILWSAADSGGFPTNGWMTFKQADEKGAHVLKGSRGTQVVFTKRLKIEEEDEEKTISLLRAYTVFNIAQIEGLPEAAPGEDLAPEQREETADQFIRATKADIRYGGDRACYIPSHDFINLPPRSSFKSQQSFVATILHELGHWTGSEPRLDRNLTGRFGTHAYAAEELIAELTAAFLCAHLGITGELQHAGYIAHWIQLLKDDNRAIFTASSKASQAANFLRAFSEPEGDDE